MCCHILPLTPRSHPPANVIPAICVPVCCIAIAHTSRLICGCNRFCAIRDPSAITFPTHFYLPAKVLPDHLFHKAAQRQAAGTASASAYAALVSTCVPQIQKFGLPRRRRQCMCVCVRVLMVGLLGVDLQAKRRCKCVCKLCGILLCFGVHGEEHVCQCILCILSHRKPAQSYKFCF